MGHDHGEFTVLVILYGSLPNRLPDQYAQELRWALEHKQPLPVGWHVKSCEAFRTDSWKEEMELKEFVRDVFGLREFQGYSERVVFRDPQLALSDFEETKEQQ